MRIVLLIVAFLLTSGGQFRVIQAADISVASGINSPNNSVDRVFETLMDDQWAATLAANPTFATSLGVREYDHKLSNPSLEAYEDSIARATRFLERLSGIDQGKLSNNHKINYLLLKLELADEIAAAQFGGKYFIMNNRSGPHLTITSMVGRLPFFKGSDYGSYLKRLAAVPQ